MAQVGEVKRAFEAGDYRGAATILEGMLRRQPGRADLLLHLAIAQMQLGRFEQARRAAERGLRAKPDDASLLARLARIHKSSGDLDAALRCAERAIASDRDNPEAISVRAELLMDAGRHDQAAALLGESMERVGPSPELAIAMGSACVRLGRIDEGIATLQPLREDRSLSRPTRRTLLFRLGDLYDRAERFDEAFEAYQQANRLRDTGFRPRWYTESIDAMIRAWTPEALARAPRSGCASDRPVFIVGMPRSGTTLVEQILSSHPSVHGGGELPLVRQIALDLRAGRSEVFPQHVHRLDRLRAGRLGSLARRYLDGAARGADRATRVTDKDPFNAEQLGLIGRLLPESRVIHCVRDPMDTCLSCYFQDFFETVPFAFDLRHLGSVWHDRARLMEHWNAVLDLPILSVRYERLVAEPESQIRSMLEFVGVVFDERCLSFHESSRVAMTASNEQVRRPVYTSSVGRAQRYASHLGPLREALRGRAGTGSA